MGSVRWFGLQANGPSEDIEHFAPVVIHGHVECGCHEFVFACGCLPEADVLIDTSPVPCALDWLVIHQWKVMFSDIIGSASRRVLREQSCCEELVNEYMES
jgi:hypothetical protein